MERERKKETLSQWARYRERVNRDFKGLLLALSFSNTTKREPARNKETPSRYELFT
jgi:hypothetical protein